MTIKRYCFYCGTPLERVGEAEGHVRLVCPTCHAKFYKNPIPAVAALVVKGEELLLVKRAAPPLVGSWCLPGGFIESGEDVSEALARELYEETGLRVKSSRLVNVISYVDENPEGKGVIIIGYRVEAFEGNPRPGDDAQEVKFFPLTDLPPIPFSSHVALIGKIKEGNPGIES